MSPARSLLGGIFLGKTLSGSPLVVVERLGRVLLECLCGLECFFNCSFGGFEFLLIGLLLRCTDYGFRIGYRRFSTANKGQVDWSRTER